MAFYFEHGERWMFVGSIFRISLFGVRPSQSNKNIQKYHRNQHVKHQKRSHFFIKFRQKELIKSIFSPRHLESWHFFFLCFFQDFSKQKRGGWKSKIFTKLPCRILKDAFCRWCPGKKTIHLANMLLRGWNHLALDLMNQWTIESSSNWIFRRRFFFRPIR